MPNIKSSIKSVKKTAAQTLNNRKQKSNLRKTVKKCETAIKDNNVELKNLITTTEKLLAKAGSKKLIHKNAASRKISRLTRAANKAQAANK